MQNISVLVLTLYLSKISILDFLYILLLWKYTFSAGLTLDVGDKLSSEVRLHNWTDSLGMLPSPACSHHPQLLKSLQPSSQRTLRDTNLISSVAKYVIWELCHMRAVFYLRSHVYNDTSSAREKTVAGCNCHLQQYIAPRIIALMPTIHQFIPPYPSHTRTFHTHTSHILTNCKTLWNWVKIKMSLYLWSCSPAAACDTGTVPYLSSYQGSCGWKDWSTASELAPPLRFCSVSPSFS